MLFIVITMLVILLVAGAVVLYVAFPHRGEPVPVAPWLGEAMARAADALPILDEARDPEPGEVWSASSDQQDAGRVRR